MVEIFVKQLFATVKTGNYESTLRMLSQGADANYRNSQEEGQSCLHTAVLHNQLGQIEMLCLYGADLTTVDRNGLTPYELAKANNMSHIADRLVELQFELTDEFSYFLCGKRPEHAKGKSFLIPDQSERYTLSLRTHLRVELSKS
jgi:G protein-coupled receptor kinase interacting protein 2